MSTCTQTKRTSPEQIAHFNSFGFLVLRQAFDAREVDRIRNSFEVVIARALEKEGKHRDRIDTRITVDPGFCHGHPDLLALLEDDRIAQTVQDLVGPDTFFKGSDGHLYMGDTGWHADTGWHPDIPGGRSDPNREKKYPHHFYPGVKVAMYLDQVKRDTGCLRVIPGSHLSPYHEMLGPIFGDAERDEWFHRFGCEPSDVPCCALESEPGDVVCFGHQLWHSSFGGGRARRMFSMNFLGGPTNDTERKFADGMKARARRIAEEAVISKQ